MPSIHPPKCVSSQSITPLQSRYWPRKKTEIDEPRGAKESLPALCGEDDFQRTEDCEEEQEAQAAGEDEARDVQFRGWVVGGRTGPDLELGITIGSSSPLSAQAGDLVLGSIDPPDR